MEDVDDMSAQNPPKTIKYVRRADRTPEKDFHTMEDDEKKHISVTRSAVNRVRDKITHLEDEIDKRDQEIDREKDLRVAAEAKLQSRLKDMYGDPGVNQELRDRLPRAGKSDPLAAKSDPFKKVEDLSETDLSSIEEQIIVEEENGLSASRPPLQNGDRSGYDNQHHDKDHTSMSSRRRLDFSGDSRTPKVNTETQTNGLERTPTFPFTNFSPSQGYFSASPYSPFNPYQPSSLPGSFQSPFLRSSLLSPPSLARHRSAPLLNNPGLNPSFTNSALSSSYPNTAISSSYATQAPDQEPIISKVLTSNTFAPPPTVASSAAGEVTHQGEATAAASGAMRGQGLLQTGLESAGAMGGGMRSFLPSQTSSLHTSLLPDPFLPSVSPRLPMSSSLHPDQSKQIAILISEIDSQRTEVKKMKDSLAEKDLEIGVLKVTLNTQDAEKLAATSDKTADKAAGLVEEVYAAQKKRDEATSRRVKVAGEEKDDVMARLRELEARLEAQSGKGAFNQSIDDMPVEDELLDLEDVHLMSPSSMDNQRPGLFHRVEAMKERQREVMKEELQIVMEQRDIALARCHKLETELLRYQKESDADGGMDKNLKAKLATVQQERDMAVAKSKQLDNEIQTIRLYYSLYKSLSGENTLQQSANHTVPVGVQEELKSSRQEVEQVLAQNNQLAQENHELKKQLQHHTIDKKQLQQALESVTQEKERFQRLASVLRRKLNNLTDENKGEEKKE